MRVIAKPRLREFWESRKHNARIAERDLSAWYKLARSAAWNHFAALKQTFGSADQVGNCVVFDVGNNRFRLIGRVNYCAGHYLRSEGDGSQGIRCRGLGERLRLP